MSKAKATAGADRSAAETSEQYLTFMLAGEEYGVDILRVQEIKGWDKVTRIPHTPAYVLGVINLRGAVVPILDLRRRFGLETIDFGPTTVVIVVRASGGGDERTVGVVVDAKPGAENYYSRYGFVELEATEGMLEERPTPKPMFLSVTTIVQALKAAQRKKSD